MDKPLIMTMSELESKIVKDINDSKVPAFITRRILETMLINVTNLEKQELQLAQDKYLEEQSKEKNKDKN